MSYTEMLVTKQLVYLEASLLWFRISEVFGVALKSWKILTGKHSPFVSQSFL